MEILFIHGGLTITGQKSAAVTHPDGSLRQLFCVESTDLWFEDFGKADLTAGAADIALDQDFAALVGPDLHSRAHILNAIDRAGTLFRTVQTARPTVHIGDGPHAGAYRSRAIGRNGVVASTHGLALTAGLKALVDGGTAIGAAVAVGAALGVVEPYMSATVPSVLAGWLVAHQSFGRLELGALFQRRSSWRSAVGL